MAYGTILGQTPAPDFPVGGIILWSGSTSDIPTKWHLCDGTNGTPDLRGRFVIGAGGSYDVGATGGESEHTLTVDEMPSHKHNSYIFVSGATGSANYVYTNTANSVTGTNSPWMVNTGGSQPHNNLPPYYALCYIMKIA